MSDLDPRLEGALWELVRATSQTSGDAFFVELSRTLAAAIDLEAVVVAEVTEERGNVQTLAVWANDSWQPNLRYAVEDTPCGLVHSSRETVSIERDARKRFPRDKQLQEWGVETYLGTPLLAASGAVIGHLCAMGRRPPRSLERARLLLTTFASRAASELERTRTERELKRQRTFLRQVLDIDPSLIFVKDRQGRFLLANEALASAYGTNIDDIVGKTDADFNPSAEEVEFFRRVDLEVMDSRREVVIPEEPVTEAGGKMRWFQTIKRPIVGSDGRADLVLGVATDITELKRTREQLLAQKESERQQIRAELDTAERELVRQARLAAIGQVAAMIAHELRNPLGAIHNAVFYLRRRDSSLDAKWVQYLEIIRQEVQSADRIVSDLLEMTRAKDPAKEPVELGPVVWEIFERTRRGTEVRLELRLDPEPFVIHADPQQLRQVLANLFTNAIQALGSDGSIVVRGEQRSDADVLTVSDDGPGIAASVRDRLFEPLVTTKAKGTGLGLAICRQILERHGATIEVAPSTRGATFQIRLPRE